MLGGVESHDTNRVAILPGLGDYRFQIGALGVRLGISALFSMTIPSLIVNLARKARANPIENGCALLLMKRYRLPSRECGGAHDVVWRDAEGSVSTADFGIYCSRRS